MHDTNPDDHDSHHGPQLHTITEEHGEAGLDYGHKGYEHHDAEHEEQIHHDSHHYYNPEPHVVDHSLGHHDSDHQVGHREFADHPIITDVS